MLPVQYLLQQQLRHQQHLPSNTQRSPLALTWSANHLASAFHLMKKTAQPQTTGFSTMDSPLSQNQNHQLHQQQKPFLDSLDGIKEESHELTEIESLICEMGPSDPRESMFQIGTTSATTLPVSPSFATSASLFETMVSPLPPTSSISPRSMSDSDQLHGPTAISFSNLDSSMIMMDQPGFLMAQQQQQQSPPSLSIPELSNHHIHSLPTSGNMTMTSNENNIFVLDTGIPTYEQQQQAWLWGAHDEGSFRAAVDSMLQTRAETPREPQDQVVEHPHFHHQDIVVEPAFWHPNALDMAATARSMAMSEHVSNTITSPPRPSSTRQDGEAKTRRRSSKSKVMSPASSNAGSIRKTFSDSSRRPRARSTVTSPTLSGASDRTTAAAAFMNSRSSFSSSAMVAGVAMPSTSDVRNGVEGSWMMECSNITGQEDSGAPVAASPSAPRASLLEADEIDLDLTTLLSSSIGALGFQDSLSPSLTRSATTSPSSSTSSSPSPSPKMTTATTSPMAATGPSQRQQSMEQILLPPLLPCPVTTCSKAFSRMYNLNTHLRTQHNLPSQDLTLLPLSFSPPLPSTRSLSSTPPPQCAIFKSTSASPPPFATSTNVNFNVSTSTSVTASGSTSPQPKLFPCHLCPRIFSRKHDLQRHIRVHTGSKPYVCMNCHKAFARTDALCRHYKIEETCRKVVVQLESDQGVKRLQQTQVQQTLQMEIKELQRAQKMRQQQEKQQQQQEPQQGQQLQALQFEHHHQHRQLLQQLQESDQMVHQDMMQHQNQYQNNHQQHSQMHQQLHHHQQQLEQLLQHGFGPSDPGFF